MIVRSQKSMKSRKIAYYIIGLIILFYIATIIIKLTNGNGNYIEQVWDFVYFLGFVGIAYIILPPDQFEFTSDEFKFHDYKRRKIKLTDIDYIYRKDKFILLETKAEKKFEISISNFSQEEMDKVYTKFKELNIRELKDEI